MRVVITGGAGFLGTTLANRLVAAGHTVLALDDLTAGDPRRLAPEVLLTRGDVEGAIRALERAVSINPSNGPGYYYLAEAWTGKGNYDLALQFNNLAGIYVRTNHLWEDFARIQKEEIEGFITTP